MGGGCGEYGSSGVLRPRCGWCQDLGLVCPRWPYSRGLLFGWLRVLSRGETTDTLGGFYRMVRSSVVVFGGSGARLRAGKEDALGVVSSQSTRFKVKVLYLCVFGGGVEEMGA